VPRIRTIKPELPQDVKLASVSRDARYTFVLLITQADDEGLIPGAHRQLLGLLYPHDEDVTTAQLLIWVEELVSMGAVRWRSTVDGAPILELANWAKHQRVDNKGRSQLSGFLVPLAESRREPPRTAATRGISPLGSRTKEVGGGGGAGEPSGADAPPPPAIRVLPAKRPSAPAWVAEGVSWWVPLVGSMTPSRFQKALGPIVTLHTWPNVRPDLERWIRERKAQGKPCKLEWYAETASSRITGTGEPPLWDYERECLTDYGERVTRPVSA
jgi:hypothetical protein